MYLPEEFLLFILRMKNFTTNEKFQYLVSFQLSGFGR